VFVQYDQDMAYHAAELMLRFQEFASNNGYLSYYDSPLPSDTTEAIKVIKTGRVLRFFREGLITIARTLGILPLCIRIKRRLIRSQR